MTANIIIQSSVGTPGTIANNSLSNLASVATNVTLNNITVGDLTATGSVNIDAGTIDGTNIGVSAQGTVKASTLESTGNTTVTGELLGCRECVSFGLGSQVYPATTAYWLNFEGNACSTTYGIPMLRAGSVIGISGIVNCTAKTTNGRFYNDVFKNDGTTVISDYVTITNTGIYTYQKTRARGTQTFVAGDIITARGYSDLFVGTVINNVLVEVVFDS